MPQSELQNLVDDLLDTTESPAGGNGSMPVRCAEHDKRLALLESSFADQTQHLCDIKCSLRVQNKRIGKVARSLRNIQSTTSTKVNILWYFVGTVFAAGVVQAIVGHFFK